MWSSAGFPWCSSLILVWFWAPHCTVLKVLWNSSSEGKRESACFSHTLANTAQHMLGLLCHRDTLLTCINLSARILRSFSARLLSICSAYAVLWSHSSPGAGLCICLFWTWLLCAHSGPYESSLPSSILTKSKCLFFLISGTFLQLSVCTCKWFWSSWANYQRELGAQNQNPKNTFLPYPLSLIVSYIPFESSAWNQGKIMYTALIKLPAKNFLHFFF